MIWDVGTYVGGRMHVQQTTAPTAHMTPDDTWQCGDCPPGVEWPCTPARSWLRVTYPDGARDILLGWLRHLLVEAAAGTLADVRAGDLHDRFVGWALPRPEPVGYVANRPAEFRH